MQYCRRTETKSLVISTAANGKKAKDDYSDARAGRRS
jgi:hypothetical protein